MNDARPGIPAAVPGHERKVENGDLHINLTPATKRVQARHPAHPLIRAIRREPGPLRVAGISITAMSRTFPRYSTSTEDHEFRPGRLLFVPAQAMHRFHGVQENLVALVFFAPAEGSMAR